MENHDSLHDIPTWYESCLGRLDHLLGNQREHVGQDLGEDFKTHIKEADGPKLLNFDRFLALG
jgi:hypothetical protein